MPGPAPIRRPPFSMRFPRFGLIERFRRRVPPIDRPPVTLDRRRIYILPTRHGLLFITVLLAMLLGSINYNNNLGFLLTFLLGGMAFISILYTARNLSGVTVLSALGGPVFAGERARVKVQVRASHAGGVVRPSIRFELPDGDPAGVSLDPDETAQVEIELKTRRRGILKPGPLVVSTRYPLGIFRAWARPHPPVEIPVYPRPMPGPFTLAAGGDRQGADDGEGGIGAEDFEGLRSYQPGDAIQHISWKTLSRGQGVHTKVFTGGAGSAVTVDWATTSGADTEGRLARMCHLVIEADRRHLVYGLRLPGRELPPDRGTPHLHRCLTALARFGSDGD